MDEIIRRFDAVRDDDLMRCDQRGVAYQRDMSKPIDYNDAYWKHYADLEGSEVANKINAARISLVNEFCGDLTLLDVGIGSGEFIKLRPNTMGTDVNKKALSWLSQNNLNGTDKFGEFEAYTFWDVIEHIQNPNQYFKLMPDNCWLFTSLPTFNDLRRVRKSKHYKPNEHFYYWTEAGFVDWMAEYRFRLLDKRYDETKAGREGITSFAFKRDLPGYHQTIDQYRQMYEPNYGASAYLYFDQIAQQVKNLNPGSILDYGCGRSDLASHFWLDGRRKIKKYDPAIPQFRDMPEGQFGLVICCDVMEHILMIDVDRVFNEIRSKSANAIFTISMKPARAKLPDGRNAHVSLLSADEWTRWITGIFGKAIRIATHDTEILMLKTFG